MNLRTWLRAGLIGSAIAGAVVLSGGSSSAAEPVQVDNSMANGVATGKVVDSSPQSALVQVKNSFHFWFAIDLEPQLGNVQFRPTVRDPGGIFAAGGLLPANGVAAWDGNFSSGGSQSVHVHYDLVSAGGAAALSGTVLMIVSDTLGYAIKASAPEVIAAIDLIKDVPDIIALGQALSGTPPNVWSATEHLYELLIRGDNAKLIVDALAKVGIPGITQGNLAKLATAAGLLSFVQTMIDIGKAGIGGHTDGLVQFYSNPSGNAPVTITQSPKQASAPSAPALVSPANGSSFPQTQDITLSWNTAGAQSYTELWGGPYDTLSFGGWTARSSLHIGQMWPGTYTWHVKARNGTSESGWSSAGTFTINASSTQPQPPVTQAPVTQPPVTQPPVTVTPPTPVSAPSAPALVSPANGFSFPQTQDITLSWNTTGAQSYTELWGGPYDTLSFGGWTARSSVHIGQMWPGTYTWHVKARNGTSESGWSPTRTFTINTPPTPMPTPTPCTQPPVDSRALPSVQDLASRLGVCQNQIAVVEIREVFWAPDCAPDQICVDIVWSGLLVRLEDLRTGTIYAYEAACGGSLDIGGYLGPEQSLTLPDAEPGAC